MKTDIIIADDHPLFRKAVIATLENSENNYVIIGEASNGEELVNLIENNKPDLVLLDLSLPKKNGYEVLKWIHHKRKEIKTLVISAFDDDVSIRKTINEGANGYLTKSAKGEDILLAIQNIIEHGFYFTEKTHLALVNKLKTNTSLFDNMPPTKIELDDREIKMIQMYSEGQTNFEIAEQLFISPRTVETIRQHMVKKAGVKNIIGLILFAIKNGIINV